MLVLWPVIQRSGVVYQWQLHIPIEFVVHSHFMLVYNMMLEIVILVIDACMLCRHY